MMYAKASYRNVGRPFDEAEMKEKAQKQLAHIQSFARDVAHI